MDARTAMALEQMSEGLLAHASMEEKKLDAQINELENMDEDDFEALRQKRKAMLMKKAKKEQDWKQLGHGRYLELTDTKEFFDSAKKSERMVCHFYRGVTPRCEIVDAHFQKLAPTHLETRFVKINAEKNLFLVERLGIIMMPTIVLILNGKTEHSIIGFDEMGGTDDFTTDELAYVLAHHKVLNFDKDMKEEIAKRSARAGGVNTISIKSGAYAATLSDSDDDFS
jgi:hypothetical protein